MTVSFRIGDEHGWIAASVGNAAGYAGPPQHMDWRIRAECGDFRGDFSTPLTSDEVAEFWAALVGAFDATDDGECLAQLGTGPSRAASLTVHRADGGVSHAIATLTPHGNDPIPRLTMWLRLDETDVRSTAESVLGSLA